MFAEIRRDFLTAEGGGALPFVPCTIGASEAQSVTNRPEGFHFHHVLWVKQGEGLIRVADQSRVLTAGEGFFCRKNIPHSYERAGAVFSTRWITFWGGESALDYYRAPDVFFFRATPALIASTSALESLCTGSSTLLSRAAAGYTWLSEWLEGIFAPARTPVTAIHQYLEAHFDQPLTLDEIAAQVRMDRFSLCRYYRESQGTTVMEALKRIRIAKAKQFLRYASCSIEEVGALCGYNSPSYFGKIFREETGRSPRAYREQHRR